MIIIIILIILSRVIRLLSLLLLLLLLLLFVIIHIRLSCARGSAWSRRPDCLHFGRLQVCRHRCVIIIIISSIIVIIISSSSRCIIIITTVICMRICICVTITIVPWCLRRLSLSALVKPMCSTNKPPQAKHAEADPTPWHTYDGALPTALSILAWETVPGPY